MAWQWRVRHRTTFVRTLNKRRAIISELEKNALIGTAV